MRTVRGFCAAFVNTCAYLLCWLLIGVCKPGETLLTSGSAQQTCHLCGSGDAVTKPAEVGDVFLFTVGVHMVPHLVHVLPTSSSVGLLLVGGTK